MDPSQTAPEPSIERDDGALDEVRPLVLALKEHHGRVAPELGPVRSDEECWTITRARYARQLAEEDAALFVARDGDGALIGYAFVVPAAELGDWDLPALEIDDIVVAAQARRTGVGGRLMAAVREHASGREIRLSVLDSNRDALRFYAREGFVPFIQTLALRPQAAPPG